MGTSWYLPTQPEDIYKAGRLRYTIYPFINYLKHALQEKTLETSTEKQGKDAKVKTNASAARKTRESGAQKNKTKQ